jgi:hypothetical protein
VKESSQNLDKKRKHQEEEPGASIEWDLREADFNNSLSIESEIQNLERIVEMNIFSLLQSK